MLPEPDDSCFQIRTHRGLAIVAAPVTVDPGNGQRFWEALATACAGHELVIVDMTATESCGLETLTALIMALRYIDSDGTDLRLAASPAVRDLISSTGLRDVLATFDSTCDAFQAPHPRRCHAGSMCRGQVTTLRSG